MSDYSITLNLKGDILQKLNLVEKKIDTISKKAKSVGVSGGGSKGNSLQNASSLRYSQSTRNNNSLDLLKYRIAHRSLIDMNGYLEGMRNFSSARRYFFKNFWRNSFSFEGIYNNIGNLTSMITNLGNVALKAVPALGTIVKTFAAISAIRLGANVAGFIAYNRGKKSLLSEETQTAISNITNYEMVKTSRGNKKFDEFFNVATDISQKTGASRVGTISLLNTLSGLNVGGKKLTDKDAAFFAEAAAKISAASGRDMQIVGLNLQQILTTWQGIDIKELFKSLPILEKYLFDIKEKYKQNDVGIYEFLRKNPSALIEIFARFMQEFNLPEQAKSVGKVRLSEEELNMAKTGFFDKYYEQVAETTIQINKFKSQIYEALGNIDWKSLMTQVRFFFEGITSIATTFINLISNIDFVKLNSILKYAARGAAIGGTAGAVVGTAAFGNTAAGAGIGTAGGAVVGGTYGYFFGDSQEEVDKKDWIALKKIIYPEKGKNIYDILHENGYLSTNIYRDDQAELKYSSLGIGRQNKIILGHSELWDLIGNQLDKNPTLVRDLLDIHKKSGLSPDFFDTLLKNTIAGGYNYKPEISGTNTVGGSSDAEQLKDLTRGSRSLIINFNKSIVEMVNNLSPTNTEELLGKIEEITEEAITRGLHIALNNATLAAT